MGKQRILLHYAVEPVLNSTILSSHLLLSGHVAKSKKLCNINATKVTFLTVYWEDRVTFTRFPNLFFYGFETVLNGQQKGTTSNMIQYKYLLFKSLFGNIFKSTSLAYLITWIKVSTVFFICIDVLFKQRNFFIYFYKIIHAKGDEIDNCNFKFGCN